MPDSDPRIRLLHMRDYARKVVLLAAGKDKTDLEEDEVVSPDGFPLHVIPDSPLGLVRCRNLHANQLPALQRLQSLAFDFGTSAYAEDRASLPLDGLLRRPRHRALLINPGPFNVLGETGLVQKTRPDP
jgi:hypothetical protein